MTTMQMYEVYTLALYCKDKCFNVFLSFQRRYCLELKKLNTENNRYIYIYILCVCVCVCVCVCARARARVCIYQFTSTKRARKCCHKHSCVLTDTVVTFIFIISTFPIRIIHLFRIWSYIAVLYHAVGFF
jgi:hypothetical protein